MSQLLQKGQTVNGEFSGPCEVLGFLGGGGQGEVYRARVAGQELALKWYYAHSATPGQRAALEFVIQRGRPSDRYLWPLELVSSPDVPHFGYLMPLREPRYKGLVDLMKRRIEPTFRALTTACQELAEGYFQLHSSGLCYGDINWGNVFMDPQTGGVLICDNDNVVVNGSEMIVLGTMGFMAPEIVRKEAKPSADTDRYSLAVLLFYMLMMHHPLEGKREAGIRAMDIAAMNKLYGKEPLFIFDPTDRSNEPVAGMHDNAIAYWPIYPKFLQDLFVQAFGPGLRDPNARVMEGQWRAALVRLRDSIVYCPTCGAQNFYDETAVRPDGTLTRTCWSDQAEMRLPPRIRIGKSVIMLNHDTVLHPHHVDEGRAYDFSEPVARVRQHPTNPGLWGLSNASKVKWTVTTSQGSPSDVPPGKSVSLVPGTKIQFGTREGEIRV